MTEDTTELRAIYRKLDSIRLCTPIPECRAIGKEILEVLDTWDYVSDELINSCIDLANVEDDEDYEVIMSSVSVMIFSVCYLIVDLEESI